MRATPVKGTTDFIPAQAALRDYMQNSILETYKAAGFARIMTPAIEDAENLDKSEGGDNLNLIFKILKRGQKLDSALAAGQFEDLTDLGLRYDLTLPLCRFVANNRQHVTFPFKVIQIDKVYRAERPQKGRMREFVQCDIDIIGTDSVDAEVELIHVTATALKNMGLSNFKVKVNDRRALNALLISFGFSDDDLPSVCITFDKLDKIGADAVSAELMTKGFAHSAVGNLIENLCTKPIGLEDIRSLLPADESTASLHKIISESQAVSQGNYEVIFDISLARGQGYYTGTVFEIESLDFGSAIAGGGRYDDLIGKFTRESIPAVGFSIGFERIYSLLLDSGFTVPRTRAKIAVIYDTDYVKGQLLADKLQSQYDVTLLAKPKKMGKLIFDLKTAGYFGVVKSDESDELLPL